MMAFNNWVETHRASSLVLALGCCILATLLSVYNILQHLTHYTRPRLQRYIVRILGIVPVYAMSSFLSLVFVNCTLYFDSIRDCYEAFVVYSFLALVLSFAGGESVCVLKIQSEPELCHMWPLNRWFKPLGRDGRLLRLCQRATLQFILLKPVFAALSLVMLASGTYQTFTYQLLLFVVYNVSYTAALYALWLFFLATKHVLEPFQPRLKFFAVKGVVFLTFWQTSLLECIPGSTKSQRVAWKELILCLEMVLFAILHLIAFNSNQFRPTNLDRLPDSEVLNNMKEVLSLTDILADAYHNFMPSYRDYMLQRTSDILRKATAASDSDHSTAAASSEAIAHSHAHVPRLVIDDEMEEIDLNSTPRGTPKRSLTSTTALTIELPLEALNADPKFSLIIANPRQDARQGRATSLCSRDECS